MIIAIVLTTLFLLSLLLIPVWARWEMPGFLDSLRLGRFHHTLAGFVVGSFVIPEFELGRQVEGLRTCLISLALVWIGLRAGLDLDLGRYRKRPVSQMIFSSLQNLVTIFLLFGGVLLVSALLRAHFGIRLNTMLLSLILAVSAATIRSPVIVFHWRGKVSHHGLASESTLGVGTNTASMVLLFLCFPIFYNDAVLYLGPYTSVGSTTTLATIVALGVLLGVLVDFIFRSFEVDISCAYLSTSVSLVVASLCLVFSIPALLVGFLAGAWLINTTIRRRSVLELTERISGVAEPAFFFLLGSILGVDWVSEWPAIGMFVVAVVLSRSVAKGIGQAVADKLQTVWQSWSIPLATGLLPMGTISIACVAQTYYLAPPLHRPELLVACLLGLYFSQLLPTPRLGGIPEHRQQPAAQNSD
ncbi:MAG: hypothetical protein CME25_13100 [Gemmatimonadetes bacterium]|nr:hypothetical protein [Gemmatimonadota bacterium]